MPTPASIIFTTQGAFTEAVCWAHARCKFQGHWLQSLATVTIEANELIAKVHPKVPVLHSRDYDRWLDGEETERLSLDLLPSYGSEEMEFVRTIRR